MTTGSRILGFVRDALVAAVLGTGPAADAYLAAFRFPNLFRRLFAEGAFNTAFLPLFVPGFLDDPAKYDLTVLLTRICFPYLMCMSLMAAYAAILNGLGRFTAGAFAPVLLNVVMIAFM